MLSYCRSPAKKKKRKELSFLFLNYEASLNIEEMRTSVELQDCLLYLWFDCSVRDKSCNGVGCQQEAVSLNSDFGKPLKQINALFTMEQRSIFVVLLFS